MYQESTYGLIVSPKTNCQSYYNLGGSVALLGHDVEFYLCAKDAKGVGVKAVVVVNVNKG